MGCKMGKTNRRKRRNGKKKRNNQIRMAVPESKAEAPSEKEATEALPAEEGKAVEASPAEEADSLQQPPKVKWKRRLKWYGIAAGAIVLTVYLSGLLYFRGRFLANTTINGVDTSLLTVEEAEERIKTNVEKYGILLKERKGKREHIDGDEIGYHYDSDGQIFKLQREQPLAFWFAGYFHTAELTVDADVQYDDELLEKKIDGLNCFTKEEEQFPMNARMVFADNKFIVQKEEQGCKVKRSRLLEGIKRAIQSGDRILDLEAEACYAAPTVTSDDKALNRLVENMNHYADIEITYCFGEQMEVLDGSTIKDWLTYDNKGKVMVKDGAIRDYVAYLADKYDTYGENRRFRTTDGSYVSVRGESYGWKLDQELEAQELTKLMEEEPHMKRIPLFAQTADSWENDGIGDSYVEVDLTKQHLWMYKEGELVVESDFVSGKMNEERYTPPGIFRVAFKKSPAVLKSNKPGDSYENPVTFWMPFNGGIGFHDSSWRSSYGGDIFWSSGSHGCINLPYDAAETIYKNIEPGYLVVCFYRGDEVKKWED